MRVSSMVPVQAAAVRVVFCALCSSLCAEATPDVFTHLNDVCRECYLTGEPCPYPEEHGKHTYRQGGQEITCLVPEPYECGHCHRLVDAEEMPCPDHFRCCGCCEAY